MKLRNIMLSIICLLITNLNAISLGDYIATNGMPEVKTKDGCVVLYLSNRNLTDLEGLDSIPGIETVECLYLYGNELTKLHENEFSRLVSLTRLHLSDNKLIELDERAFNGLVNLKSLCLNHNQLEGLPEKIFNPLIKLEMLFMYNNKFIEFPKSIFKRLDNLRVFYIYNNKIPLTNAEFIETYLTKRQAALITGKADGLDFIFKLQNQEEAESIQRELIQNMKSKEIDFPRIYHKLGRLSELRAQGLRVYILPQKDDNGDTALHLALRLFKFDLLKDIFDVMPECAYETNKKGENIMHLLFVFKDPVYSDEDDNMVCIIDFLKYIFRRDPNLAQLLCQQDNEGISPIRYLIVEKREDEFNYLVELTNYFFYY